MGKAVSKQHIADGAQPPAEKVKRGKMKNSLILLLRCIGGETPTTTKKHGEQVDQPRAQEPTPVVRREEPVKAVEPVVEPPVTPATPVVEEKSEVTNETSEVGERLKELESKLGNLQLSEVALKMRDAFFATRLEEKQQELQNTRETLPARGPISPPICSPESGYEELSPASTSRSPCVYVSQTSSQDVMVPQSSPYYQSDAGWSSPDSGNEDSLSSLLKDMFPEGEPSSQSPGMDTFGFPESPFVPPTSLRRPSPVDPLLVSTSSTSSTSSANSTTPPKSTTTDNLKGLHSKIIDQRVPRLPGACREASDEDSRKRALFVISMLPASTFDLSTVDANGNSCLHLFIMEKRWILEKLVVDRKYLLNGYLERLERLCGQNSVTRIALDVQNKNAETPLYLAVRENLLEVAGHLLRYGADPTTPCTDKWQSPLHCAVRNNNVDMVNLILHMASRDEDVYMRLYDLRDADRHTPLSLACAKHNPSYGSWIPIIQLLVSRGFVPNWNTNSCYHPEVRLFFDQLFQQVPDEIVELMDVAST